MATAKKVEVFVIPIKDIDVRFTYSNKIISYFFVYNGKNYGNALNIEPEDKKRPKLEDGIRGGGLLMLNAYESVLKILEELETK